MSSLSTGDPPPRIADFAARRRSGKRVLLRALFSYLAAVFLGAALIAPWIYAAVQNFAPDSFLARYPFYRFVNRGIIILALLGLWPLARDLRRLGVVPAPLGFDARRAHHWLHGFVWGFGIIAIAAGLAMMAGARVPELDHPAASWLKHLTNAALAALLAGFIEEILFRGALFGGLRRQETFFAAAFFSSLFFAILHFLERPQNPHYIEWHSGLLVLGQMLRGFADWQALVPGLINLTLVGIALCLAFERTQSILFSFGMHAGLIFWVKSFGFLTRPAPQAEKWIWGGTKLIDGWINFVILAIVCFGLHRTLRSSDHEKSAQGIVR